MHALVWSRSPCPTVVCHARMLRHWGRPRGRSGSCAKQDDLGLQGNESMGDMDFMAIFGALEAGSCPSLKRLGLTMRKACMSVTPLPPPPLANTLKHAHPSFPLLWPGPQPPCLSKSLTGRWQPYGRWGRSPPTPSSGKWTSTGSSTSRDSHGGIPPLALPAASTGEGHTHSKRLRAGATRSRGGGGGVAGLCLLASWGCVP